MQFNSSSNDSPETPVGLRRSNHPMSRTMPAASRLSALRASTLAGALALLAGGCGTGLAGAVSAADSDEEPPPSPEVIPSTLPAGEDVNSNATIGVGFTLAMDEGEVRSRIRLLTPRDPSVRTLSEVAALTGDEMVEVPINVRGGGASYGVEIAGTFLNLDEGVESPFVLDPHVGRWYRLVVPAGLTAANGSSLGSSTSSNFRIRSGSFDTPELLTLQVNPAAGPVIMPGGEGLIPFETDEGQRILSARTIETQSADLREVTIRRLDVQTAFGSFPGSTFTQTKTVGLRSSRTGRAYFATYEPKGSTDYGRMPVSFMVSHLDGSNWVSTPDRSSPGGGTGFIGGFVGAEASMSDFISKVRNGVVDSPEVYHVDAAEPIKQAWQPLLVPIGDRNPDPAAPDGGDGPERAICVWIEVPDAQFDPLGENGAPVVWQGDDAATAIPDVDTRDFRTMRSVAQHGRIKFSSYTATGTSVNSWTAPADVSDQSTELPYVGSPFILSDDSGPLMVLWYQSSTPLPMSRSSQDIEPGYKSLEAEGHPLGHPHMDAFTQASDDPAPSNNARAWWPTMAGEEDIFVSTITNTANGLSFGTPTRLNLDDGDDSNRRRIVQPHRVLRTGDGTKLVFLGFDPNFTGAPPAAPPVVAQVIDLGSPNVINAPVPIPLTVDDGNGGGIDYVVAIKREGKYLNRRGLNGIRFEPIGGNGFMAVLVGYEAGPASNPEEFRGTPQLMTTVFDATGSGVWAPHLVPITAKDENLDGPDGINESGVPTAFESGFPAANVDRFSITDDLQIQFDDDGNAVVVMTQTFDLDLSGSVDGGNSYEDAMGISSVLQFDRKEFRVNSDLRRAWGYTGAAGQDPVRLLIDPTNQEFRFTRGVRMAPPDSSGRVFVSAILRDPNEPPADFLSHILGTVAIRFNANQ